MSSKAAGINKSEYTLKNNFIISEEEWEEIENFLKGDLPQETIDIMKKRLKDEPAFSEKVAHVRLLMTGIREVALEADLKKIRLPHGENVVHRIPNKKQYYFRWMAAAAIIAVVSAIAYFNVFTNSEHRLFSKYYFPDSGLVSSMGVSDNYDFDVAMINYKSGKYDQSIVEMKKLLLFNPNNDTLNYFIGNSFLALDKVDSAISYLKVVAVNNQSAFAKDANWYLGLAYLKLKQKEKAALFISRSDNEKKDELLKRISK